VDQLSLSLTGHLPIAHLAMSLDLEAQMAVKRKLLKPNACISQQHYEDKAAGTDALVMLAITHTHIDRQMYKSLYPCSNSPQVLSLDSCK